MYLRQRFCDPEVLVRVLQEPPVEDVENFVEKIVIKCNKVEKFSYLCGCV